MGTTQQRSMRPTWRTPVRAEGRDRHGLGIIDEPSCLRLLCQERIGRLGISVHSLPVILPVNYAVAGSTVLFRSEDGEKVRAARNGAVACFEVDRFDRMEHTGWSVTATGRLTVVDDDRYDEVALAPWALGDDTTLIALPIELLEGRVISHD